MALVACKEARPGPWMLPRGTEEAVKVSRLNEGEGVRLEVATHLLTREFPLKSGLNPIDVKDCVRYRVVKHLESDDPSPTTVEVLFNGTSRSV